MNKKGTASDAWLEFTTYVQDERFPGTPVPFCGLCGNRGAIETTNRVRTPGGDQPWGGSSVIVAEGVPPPAESGK
ncbi:MAG: hypothetical protein HC927_03335 [Deltaproteobacteria bacterium]|nr:hypothetical protein [Deltaproteobacteria bacterium]